MSEDETLYPYFVRLNKSDRKIMEFLRHDMGASAYSHVMRMCLRAVAVHKGYNLETGAINDIGDIHRRLKL